MIFLFLALGLTVFQSRPENLFAANHRLVGRGFRRVNLMPLMVEDGAENTDIPERSWNDLHSRYSGCSTSWVL